MPYTPPSDPPVAVLIMREVWASVGLKVMLFFAMTVFALAGVVNVLGVLDRFREPYLVHGARLVSTTPIVSGGEFIVEYDLERRRLCRTDLVRFFTELPSNSVVARDMVPGGTTALGRFTVKNTIRVPSELRAGRCYKHSLQVLSECTSSTVFNYPAPPIEFCME